MNCNIIVLALILMAMSRLPGADSRHVIKKYTGDDHSQAIDIDISIKVSRSGDEKEQEEEEGKDGGEDHTTETRSSSTSVTTEPPCPESDVDKECPDDFFMLPGNTCKMCLPPCERKNCNGLCNDDGSCTCTNSRVLSYGPSGCPQRNLGVIGNPPL